METRLSKHKRRRRAGEAVQRWMVELKEHIERNKMQDALMDQRLRAIEDLQREARKS